MTTMTRNDWNVLHVPRPHTIAPWDLIQKTMVRVITEGLVDLGLLHGQLDTLIETEAYKPFYMHSSGHWLGLDVHDVGSRQSQLEAGDVITIEPGIYIPEKSITISICLNQINCELNM